MDISQFYQINAIDDGTIVVVRRGEGAAKIISGGARWTTVSRPKRTSIVLFDGIDPWRVDVPVLFDGWANTDSVEGHIAQLNQMRVSQATLTRPSRIRIDGAMPVKGATWVIESLEFGDNVIWDTTGDKAFRYRQDATIHLLQYNPEVALRGIKPFKTNDKVVVAKAGQTAKTLAGGDPKKVKAIQKANGIRDPKTIKKGTPVRIPGNHGGSGINN